jgi:Calx-beta domain
MRARRLLLTASLTALAIVPTSVTAGETAVFTYDELGRLVKTTQTGTINNSEAHSICYDAAGNRTQYGSTSNGVVAACASSAPPAPPPPPPSSGLLTVNNAQATEGGALVFTVSLSVAQSTTVSVSYATAVGTAGSTDFIAVSGVLQFSAGQTSKTVQVTTINNTNVEGTETFSFNLSNATSPASISDAQGIGTIYDDDDAGGGDPNCVDVIC